MNLRWMLAALSLAWPGAAWAAVTCSAQSGERVVPLVELYTSEGCDSCPAADRWLSANFPPGAHADAIAIAFHVDYWDRLGWKDRFATPANTARQYQSMHANKATFVYTPQFLVRGRDDPRWRRGPSATQLSREAAQAASVRIEVRASVETSSVVVDVTTVMVESPQRGTSVAMAYVDSRLVTDVRAGENRGVKLTHDHVVRAFEARPLTSRNASVSVRLPRPVEAGTHPTLVVFVQDVAGGEVLQALAVPLQTCR